MSHLEVFDPAMCCSTGVCGPSVDPALPRFAADLDWLAQKGIKVTRYNLAQQPAAFAENGAVRDALQKGADCLPLLVLDGRILLRGTYPERGALADLLGLPGEEGAPRKFPAATKGESCGCGGGKRCG